MSFWPAGPARALAPGDAAHVWAIALDGATPDDAALLDESERDRAARFRFERDRVRFVRSHAALRRVLARYLDEAPASLQIGARPDGKPRLESGALEFNLAHSATLALVAVTRGHAVGVDVEDVRPEIVDEPLATHTFSPAELAAWRALEPAARVPAFFAGWTRKEAWLKARGDGLRAPLDGFDVTLVGPARLVATRPDPALARPWHLHDLALPPRWVGALAVDAALRLACFAAE